MVELGDDATGCPGALAVVVATLGGDEAGAIRTALDAGVPYVGLVASPRRGAAVLAEVAPTEAERARVHTPVGLYIGARTPPEIALSVLAEIVKERRLDGRARRVTSAAPEPAVGAHAPRAAS